MARLLLINGPNLNLLGSREPDIYGSATLAEIEAGLVDRAQEMGHELQTFQSNAEDGIVDRIHGARDDGIDAILFNPGAFTHTSVAIRDALLGVGIPFWEIHLSNTFAREEFRHKSFFSDIASGCLIGLGAFGYELALRAADRQLGDDGGH